MCQHCTDTVCDRPHPKVLRLQTKNERETEAQGEAHDMLKVTQVLSDRDSKRIQES